MRSSPHKSNRGHWVKVWDPLVRFGHWLLVAAFFIAWMTDDDLEILHSWSGYLVGGIVLWRLVWGVIGTKHARFTDFVYGPMTVMRYAKSMLTRHPIHYLGHNPLGGYMVIALLIMLSLTTWTGLELYGSEGKGPLAINSQSLALAFANGDDHKRGERYTENGDELWEELHEACANLTLALVLLHIVGVLFSSLIHRENLIAGMISGYKRSK
jgi:cytochrome b